MMFLQEVIKSVALFMKQNGFLKKGKCFYYIQNDVAYCVEFDYTGCLLYVTYYFVPLYIPAENRYYSYGDRLNSHPKNKLPSINSESPQGAIQLWVDEFMREIEQLVIPFFDKVSSPNKIVQYFSSPYSDDQFVHCPEIQIDRLLLFTYSYLKNKHKLMQQTTKMIHEIQECRFLSPQILDKYMDEVQHIIVLNETMDTEIDKYYGSVIQKTWMACF